MIIRKATLGLHHVYMSLYVKRTTDGGNCLIAWFGALALGIVHVLFPSPCSDPFQAQPTLSSRKGFVMQLTIPAGLALARQGRRMQHLQPQLQLQISLFSILYYSSGLSPSAAAAVDADVAFAATVNTPKCVQLERERCQSDVCHESPVWGRNISCIKTRSYASNRWERAFSLCSPPLTATMIFQSLLPPIPDPPFPNAHHLFLNRPDQAEWQDYDLHVDAPIGKARKWFEFKDRVKRGATAFRDPSLFPREENEIVGILSENCAVSSVSFYSASCADIKTPRVWVCVGVCGAYSFAAGRGYPIRSIPGISDSI